jgi:hypothetical protein
LPSIVSVVALLSQRSASEAQTKLQERVADIEVARRDEELVSRGVADVTVRLAYAGMREKFHLLNSGKATAYDVDPKADPVGKPGAPFPKLLTPLPLPQLVPDQTFSIEAESIWGMRSPYDVTVSWRDERGSQEVQMRVSQERH